MNLFLVALGFAFGTSICYVAELCSTIQSSFVFTRLTDKTGGVLPTGAVLPQVTRY